MAEILLFGFFVILFGWVGSAIWQDHSEHAASRAQYLAIRQMFPWINPVTSHNSANNPKRNWQHAQRD